VVVLHVFDTNAVNNSCDGCCIGWFQGRRNEREDEVRELGNARPNEDEPRDECRKGDAEQQADCSKVVNRRKDKDKDLQEPSIRERNSEQPAHGRPEKTVVLFEHVHV